MELTWYPDPCMKSTLLTNWSALLAITCNIAILKENLNMKLTKIIQEMNIPLDYKQFSRDIFCIMLIDKHQDSKGRDQLSDCKKCLMPPLVIKFIIVIIEIHPPTIVIRINTGQKYQHNLLSGTLVHQTCQDVFQWFIQHEQE